MHSSPLSGACEFVGRWRKRLTPARKSPEHLRLGARGEKLAANFLRRNGYKILYRNFRGRRGGEVDIVSRDGDTLVFVEVKTRTRQDFGRPAEAVDSAKQKLIARGALAWLQILDNPDILARFDIVEVLIDEGGKPRCELVRDAFQLPAPYVY
ncbi:MAG: YraN family protein [Verrucomicrobia bacterium]|nr:YraN family protein [Verrucomicrobiota bacterium]